MAKPYCNNSNLVRKQDITIGFQYNNRVYFSKFKQMLIRENNKKYLICTLYSYIPELDDLELIDLQEDFKTLKDAGINYSINSSGIVIFYKLLSIDKLIYFHRIQIRWSIKNILNFKRNINKIISNAENLKSKFIVIPEILNTSEFIGKRFISTQVIKSFEKLSKIDISSIYISNDELDIFKKLCSSFNRYAIVNASLSLKDIFILKNEDDELGNDFLISLKNIFSVNPLVPMIYISGLCPEKHMGHYQLNNNMTITCMKYLKALDMFDNMLDILRVTKLMKM